jgi:tRNA threonylcarbamoyladenosine biosynthesis protein TsaB
MSRPDDALVRELALVIEASSASGSIALVADGEVVAHRRVTMGASRDDGLFPAIQSALDAGGVAPSALTAIVCGAGPGSFTSLRIAASLAKGLAHATRVPLYAVPSLLLAAAGHDRAGDFVVHSDALRGERYAMRVRIDASLMTYADGAVTRVGPEALSHLASGRQRLAVRPFADDAAESIVVPDAANISRVFGWQEAGRVSLEQWEPAYGRLAEAQVKWEAVHGRPLSSTE